MAKKFTIYANFENGMKVRMEAHKTLRSAQAAVDAMDAHNRNDLAQGYGFPYGVPTYTIE